MTTQAELQKLSRAVHQRVEAQILELQRHVERLATAPVLDWSHIDTLSGIAGRLDETLADLKGA